MRQSYYFYSFFLFLCISCHTQSQKFDAAVRSPQVAFPSNQDKKWRAIKALENHTEDFICDTLMSIYLSIDTLKNGFGSYYDVIFNTLININTPKSAKTIEQIYRIRPPKFLSQSVIFNLSNHKYYELFFPGILNGLTYDLMNSSLILNILKKGIDNNKISINDLELFLPKLDTYYAVTKFQRDAPVANDAPALNIYYWISNPILVQCLKPVKNNSIAHKILSDAYNNSHDLKMEEDKELSWEAFKAMDTTFKADGYLLKLCKDINYRLEVYKHFKEKGTLESFPSEYYNQASLSEMICVSTQSLRRHDTNKPDAISFLGEKNISKGYYYFYRICWLENCERNSVVVVGPQPFDKTKFDDNPRYSGKTIAENVEKEKLRSIVNDFKIE